MSATWAGMGIAIVAHRRADVAGRLALGLGRSAPGSWASPRVVGYALAREPAAVQRPARSLRRLASPPWPGAATGHVRLSPQASAAATGARSRARSRSSRTATRSPTTSSRDLYPDTGRAYAVGLTGPPGVGKSSLISALVRHVRAAEHDGRRRLGRPVEPVLARRAPRRPHPPGRPLPRPGRLHPLDGNARPPRRSRRGDAAGAAHPRRGGQGRRLPRDRRHGAERGRGDRHRRHRAARAHARLGRLGAGAEGRDHGDPRRDRDQQDGSPGGEDDAERGALDPRLSTTTASGGRRSC